MNHKEIQRCLERCRDSVERYGERWMVDLVDLVEQVEQVCRGK